MDRRHGKRPLPSEASEEKKREQVEYDANYYEACWPHTDYLSATAVSDFTHQLIGSNVQADVNPTLVQSTIASTTTPPTPSAVPDESKEEPHDPSSQPPQDQAGTNLASLPTYYTFNNITSCFTLRSIDLQFFFTQVVASGNIMYNLVYYCSKQRSKFLLF